MSSGPPTTDYRPQILFKSEISNFKFQISNPRPPPVAYILLLIEHEKVLWVLVCFKG